MKIRILCTEWVAEIASLPPSENKYSSPWVKVTLQESKIYSFKCEREHSGKIILSGLKFETLFESSILALKDGYFREAVTSFAASLERFYEFIILVLVINEVKTNQIEFDKAWKSVINQSERQLGAVSFLYFKEFGRCMLTLDSSKINKTDLGGKTAVEFRNSVIHKGFIPTYISAISYGEAVAEYIRQTITELAINRQSMLVDALYYIQGNDINALGMTQPRFMLNAFF